ncbi:MAG TPA: hypothetical protein VNN17_05910 [Terriglobia bacterium]|nr:hypothetical protein [Terriglobia bacterium]
MSRKVAKSLVQETVRCWAGAVLMGMAAQAALLAQTPAPAGAPAPAPPAMASADTAPPGTRRPQAKTPEEAAAYQAFLDEKRPEERIRLVEDFLLQYPETELKEGAYLAAMQAYQQQNDFEHLLTYGELVLEQNPENLTVLLTLAAAISEMTGRSDSDRDEKLNDGDRYALRALEVIGRLRKPPGFPEERWAEMRREAEATAHAARGLIALLREDFARAELELKEAVALAKAPSAAVLYRLGIAYSFRKKYAEALEVLDRAASLGGIQLTTAEGATRDLVAEAREFAARALAGAAPAPATPPPVESATTPAPAP